MNKIYDNGALLLGNIQNVIAEVEKEIKENVDMFAIDMEELLKELKELRNIDNDMIVCINYDNGFNYSIDYWTKEDAIKESDK